MRSIARIGLIAAVATLAGCQVLPYGGDRFSTTVYDEVPARPIRFVDRTGGPAQQKG